MVDKPHLRLADHTDLANDDPFAELTKIMGFDPRQAARPAAAPEPVTVAPVDGGFDDMDFSIDLEKELMGDFADEAPMARSAGSYDPIPQAVELPHAQVAGPALEPAMTEAVASAQSEEEEFAFEDDWFSDDDTDSKAAAAIEALEPQSWSDGIVDARESSRIEAANFVDEDLPSAIPVAANDVPRIETVDPLADLDFGAGDLADTEIPPEFVMDTHDIGDHTPDIFAANHSAAPNSFPDEVELDHIFEDALADVDLHSDAAEAGPKADDFDDLDRELDLSLRGGFVSVVAPEVVDVDEYEPEASVEAEMSLEDELNALLGNGLSQQALPPVAHYVEPLAPSFQGAAQTSVAQHASGDHFAQHVEESADPEDDALLDDSVFDWRNDTKGPVAAHASVLEEFPLPAHDLAVEELDELELDFDDQAFTAAITQSIAAEAPVSEPVLEVLAQDNPEEEQVAMQNEGSPYAALAALSASLKPSRGWSRETPVAERREPSTFESPARTEEPVFARTGPYEPEPVVQPRAFRPEPAYAPEPAYEPEPDYVAASAYEKARPYRSEPIIVPERVSSPVSHAASVAHRDSFVPDIDTLDVPEQAVALADDLDLPDFAYDDEPAPAPTYDDIDAEFTSLLNDMNAADEEQLSPTRGSRFDEYNAGDRAPVDSRSEAPVFADEPYPAPRQDYAAAVVPAAVMAAAAHALPQVAPAVAHPSKASASAAPGSLTDSNGSYIDRELADMEFAYDPDLDEEMSLPTHPPVAPRQSPRRGMMIAAVVGGVAILGGIGAMALSFGGGDSSEPVLVQADNTPVKIKPENPGGTTIPNQDNKVYDTVAGGSAEADPKQEKLVSSEEEPIEMPAPMDEAEAIDSAGALVDEVAVPPSQKAEDRIELAAEDAGVDNSVEVAAVAPRKVRTMIVKADGTLVAREEPAPVLDSASAGMTDPVSTTVPTTGTVDPQPDQSQDIASAPAAEEGSLPIATTPAEPVPAPALAPVVKATEAPAEAAAPAEPAAPAALDQSSVTPAKAPLAPARPADQPIVVVGEVKPDRVAAVSSPAAATGAWAMQIASQPTEAAAKSSYQDLARRYSAVLEGREANIVKADISGKGTFWRVRVAAKSRNEAVSLCESYKSAGGSCFVSR